MDVMDVVFYACELSAWQVISLCDCVPWTASSSLETRDQTAAHSAGEFV